MAMQSYEICPTADGDVIFNGSSLGWISGYPFLYFAFGQTRVVPYVKKSPPDDEDKFLLDVLRQEKVTQLFTSPASLKKLLARNDLLKTPFTWTVRTVIFGGSVFRKEFSRILEKLSVEIRVRYGCTEIGFAAYKVYTDKVQMEDFKCGKPVKGVEIMVVDDNLKEVPPNTKGNIMIKNNGFFSGYLKQPALTAVALPEEGWFRPGDIGWLNDEGEIFIEGRQSEAISIGSFKMFPQPLESHLMKCPGVYDVAVVAIPDKDFENVPCICLVRYPTPEGDEVVPEELIRRCSEYFQESFVHENIEQELGVPKVCLVFDKFPVNSNGKLQRRALRDMAIERLFIRQTEI
ncbi:uncharacterized protein LOC112555350 [Pomacea canaliculata]|nr:uncharacterized protein LOC112555350 [Pomacea canaliculata]XP_025079493.1 uncharacterized protein LOC112555350 [Pomacea canaliculata]